jgi:cytochrome c2
MDRVSGMKRRVLLSVSLLHIFLGLSLAHSQTAAASVQEGEKIFTGICTACHTIGKGKLIGPDLSGVTTRREESWLKRQIKEPDRMIAEKDPIVMELLKESKNVPMVPLGLSDADVEAVIAYLKSTEQQASVTTGLPSQFMPTVLISVVVLIGLTLIGLRAGNKKVDVR